MAKTLIATVITACMCVISSFMSINSNRQELFAQSLDLSSATISDINKAFDDGTLTSERLVNLYLARIDSYENNGPNLNALITINEKALEKARALDAERQRDGPRSLLHGIPVVLKDNVDTQDMPTTAGSLLLKGSIPPNDAFIVSRLRQAGAIILGKANMSEFASGVTISSVDGPMLNPHDLSRTPSGSSGGTGVSIAASFAQLGIGTDTGGSVRGPSSSNGVAGLKPTHGLLSRDGIVPLALSFDMAGPMARHVFDVAAMLGAMTGVDPNDPATEKSAEVKETDYTQYLDHNALKGARIGVARDFLGYDTEVDWIIEASLEAMRNAGATIVDVRYPRWLLDAKADFYTTIRWREFKDQIENYLSTLDSQYPRTLEDMVDISQQILAAPKDGERTNPTRWSLFQQELNSGSLEDPEYLAMINHGIPLVSTILQGLLEENKLDAIVYPTAPRRPGPLGENRGASSPDPAVSATNLANLSGFPDLIVPAGFTSNGLPVGISFFGLPFSEPTLFGLGYAFEQITKARRNPVHTPPLPGEKIP
jgi:amidase